MTTVGHVGDARTEPPSGAQEGDVHPTTSRSEAEYTLKPEHAVVLEALRVAVIAYERPVIVAEVIQALGGAAQAHLAHTYTGDLATAISKVLQQLVARGVALTVGRVGKHRYYAPVGTLPAGQLRVPSEKPRRQRVLAILTEVVQERRAAVRASDVVDAAATHAEGDGLTRTLVIRDLQNLVRTRDVAVVGTVRGENDSNLYCPVSLVDMVAASVDARAPLTWLETVQQTFDTLWAEEAALAREQGRRPFALTTGAVRARLEVTHARHERLEDPRLLINALNQLASTSTPTIRALDTVGKTGTLRWVPVHVPDADIDVDGVYASDVERLVAAVTRASAQLPRARSDAPPPVCVRQVAEVIAADPALRLRSYADVSDALADAGKETLDDGDGDRARRRTQYIWRVGRIKGQAYYATSHVPEARAYVRIRKAEDEWDALDAARRVAELDRCPLPATAFGRALLLREELNALARTVRGLVDTTDDFEAADSEDLDTAADVGRDVRPDPGTRAVARRLSDDVDGVVSRLDEWFRLHPRVDGVTWLIDVRAPGWAADEFHQATRAMHPRGDIAKARAEIIRLFPKIHRVPNPEHEHRSREAARAAAENLFDRADALLHAARRWGGPMTAMRAAYARELLDRLRDARFVVLDLQEAAPSDRIGAASCLAFLQPTSATMGALRGAAVDDPDPRVRQVALWALGFSASLIAESASVDFVRAQAQRDPDRRVRDWATHALSAASGVKGWWMV